MAGLVLTSLMLGADATFAYSTTAISLLILPRPIMFALGAWIADRLVTRLGGRPVVMVGCVGIAAGLGIIGFGAVQGSVASVVFGVAMAGAGSGIARPPIIAALTEAVGEFDMGVGTGLLNMSGQIGAAAGISLLSALVTEDSSPERFLAVFVIAAVVATGAIATAGAIRFPAAGASPGAPGSPTDPYSATIDSPRARQ
jgi:MFS family permease